MRHFKIFKMFAVHFFVAHSLRLPCHFISSSISVFFCSERKYIIIACECTKQRMCVFCVAYAFIIHQEYTLLFYPVDGTILWTKNLLIKNFFMCFVIGVDIFSCTLSLLSSCSLLWTHSFLQSSVFRFPFVKWYFCSCNYYLCMYIFFVVVLFLPKWMSKCQREKEWVIVERSTTREVKREQVRVCVCIFCMANETD